MLDPRMQIFYLTDRCNNACVFCICKRHIRERIGDSPETIEQKILAIHDNGIIDIFGGEPTLSGSFMSIVRHGKQKNCLINIASNARRFSDGGFFDRFLDETDGYQENMFVRSSLHGHTAALHDAHTRRKGSFDEAIEGIMRLKRAGYMVSVNTVVTALNIKYLAHIHRLIEQRGVDVFKISFMRFTVQNARLAVALKDLKAELPKVLDQVARGAVKLDLDSIPYCVAPDHVALFAKEETKYIENDERLVKDERCGSCAVVGLCPGVDREYFALVGGAELEPIPRCNVNLDLAEIG